MVDGMNKFLNLFFKCRLPLPCPSLIKKPGWKLSELSTKASNLPTSWPSPPSCCPAQHPAKAIPLSEGRGWVESPTKGVVQAHRCVGTKFRDRLRGRQCPNLQHSPRACSRKIPSQNGKGRRSGVGGEWGKGTTKGISNKELKLLIWELADFQGPPRVGRGGLGENWGKEARFRSAPPTPLLWLQLLLLCGQVT